MPPRRTAPAIDFERWIGVRGAAVLGGAVLALAALLFFKYSIEHGLISPTMRVVLGVVTGLGCTFGSEHLRRRGQPAAANALAGAGVVILYASVWAAHTLYDLIGAVFAFFLLALVTVTCGLLSARRGSLLIAVLGLLGGFATPLLVSGGVESPYALFSYVLVLDAGLLWLARQGRWPALGLLALVGTAFHQAAWILDRMEAATVGVGLIVLAVFTALFVVVGRQRSADSRTWRLSLAGAVLIPFALALHFVGSARLGDHLAPVGVLLVLLSATACWLARVHGERLLALAAAGASTGVVALWFVTHRATTGLAWEAVLVALAVAGVFHLFVEICCDGEARSAASAAALVAAIGVLAITGLAAPHEPASLAPFLIGWLLAAFGLVRQAALTGEEWAQLLGGLGVVGGLTLYSLEHAGAWGLGARAVELGLTVMVAVGFQVVALIRREERGRRWAEHAAAATALSLLLVVLVRTAGAPSSSVVELGASLGLGLLAVLAATRLRSGTWYLVTVLATALSQWMWTGIASSVRVDIAGTTGAGLAVQGLSVALLVLWPILAGQAFSRQRAAWVGAALAGPAWFLSLKSLWEQRFGDAAIGALPVLLAVLAVAAAAALGAVWRRPSAERSSALALFLAVSLLFVSVAIPLQLDKEWITVGWALNGLAVLALWRRLDHPGLKYLGVALLAASTVRLIANPAVLGYYPRGGTIILNWLLYTYLVPAAALVASAAILRRHEADRLTAREVSLYGRPRPLLASTCGLAAVLVVFVWINLTIADAFGTAPQLVLSFERMPARDLVTSIAWAGYALLLLVLGISRDSTALRWVSLGLFVLTIAKVFLHDLGELQDLYRVASLLGLAISLIVVSLVYQRFVLRRPSREDQGEQP